MRLCGTVHLNLIRDLCAETPCCDPMGPTPRLCFIFQIIVCLESPGGFARTSHGLVNRCCLELPNTCCLICTLVGYFIDSLGFSAGLCSLVGWHQ
jgi:hypothetical protein